MSKLSCHFLREHILNKMVRNFELVQRPWAMVRIPGTGSDTTLPYSFLDLGRSSRLVAAVRVPHQAFYITQSGGQTTRVVQQPATLTPTVAATKRKIKPNSFQQQQHQDMQQQVQQQILCPAQSRGQTTTVEQ